MPLINFQHKRENRQVKFGSQLTDFYRGLLGNIWKDSLSKRINYFTPNSSKFCQAYQTHEPDLQTFHLKRSSA